MNAFPTVFLLTALAIPAAEPQPTGWPLTETEREYILQPEHARRPGTEQRKHQPALWPVTPSAGHWGGSRWLEAHTKLVAQVQANRGPIDILLVGDSLTQQWGSVLDGKRAVSARDGTMRIRHWPQLTFSSPC